MEPVQNISLFDAMGDPTKKKVVTVTKDGLIHLNQTNFFYKYKPLLTLDPKLKQTTRRISLLQNIQSLEINGPVPLETLEQIPYITSDQVTFLDISECHDIDRTLSHTPNLQSIAIGLQPPSDIIIALGRHCKHLKAIDLTYRQMSAEVASLLIKNCPNLTTIDLTGCYGFPDDLLVSIANNFPQLKSINLAKTDFKTGFETLKNLEKINSGNSYLSDSILSLFVNNNEDLTSINLRGFYNLETLSHLVQKCKKIQSISLGWPSTKGDTIRLIGNKCSNLTSIALNYPVCNDDELKALASCKKLKSILLSSAALITDWSISYLAKSNLNLEQVSLINCVRITGASLNDLFRRGIQELNLSECPIKDSSCESIDTPCRTLRQLDLSDIKLSRASYTRIGENCSNLEGISLYKSPFNDTDVKVVTLFCRHLSFIDLSHCDYLSDECLKNLEFGTNLKVIKLNECHINQDAINAFRQKHPEITIYY